MYLKFFKNNKKFVSFVANFCPVSPKFKCSLKKLSNAPPMQHLFSHHRYKLHTFLELYVYRDTSFVLFYFVGLILQYYSILYSM
jgi:hypothetical protein